MSSEALRRERAAEARQLAGLLVGELRAASPALLELHAADLAPALEQQLFFALRDDRRPAEGGWQRAVGAGRAVGRPLLAALGSLRPAQDPPAGRMVVLIREMVHAESVRAMAAQLRRRGVDTPLIVRVGRAAAARNPAPGTVRLADLMLPRLIPGLVHHQMAVMARFDGAAASWDEVLRPTGRAAAGMRSIAREELLRIGLASFALSSLVQRWHPSLLVGFDEIGTWARVLPAVARAGGIRSLDLPHAEAVDSVAIRGAGYDRMAVYGPRAAATLRSAGIAAERIVEIGAPRFDSLVAAPPSDLREDPRDVIFAAQYVTAAMSLQDLEACYLAAVAAARAVAPSRLIIRPHPAEPPGLVADIAARLGAPAGVRVRVESALGLHRLLDHAWLLVTGWSNSIFEAGLRGVPAIAVDPHGSSPVTYAAEGLALPAADELTAAAAARSLIDRTTRDEVVARARDALGQHLGAMDGLASDRAAALAVELAREAGVR